MMPVGLAVLIVIGKLIYEWYEKKFIYPKKLQNINRIRRECGVDELK